MDSIACKLSDRPAGDQIQRSAGCLAGADSGESPISEIIFAADGRIFVHGLSRELLTILQAICPSEHPLQAIAPEGDAIKISPP